MDRLPDEVLMIILDFLPTNVICLTFARVCRRWARLASTRAALVNNWQTFRAWRLGRGARTLYLTAKEPFNMTGFLRIATTAHLTELSIHLGLALSTKELVMLAELRLNHVDVFCRAEVLNACAVPLATRVSSMVVNEPLCASFLRGLAQGSKLKALHMYGRAGCYPREEMLEVINSHCDRFEELTLRCPLFKNAEYEAIGRCRELRSLKLYSCWGLSPISVDFMFDLERLRTLHLTGTCKHMDSVTLNRLILRLPRGLVELSLSASRLHDLHIFSLVHRTPQLRRLELWRTQLSTRGLRQMAGELPRLQELDVDMPIPRRVILKLAQHPSLETVRCQLPKEKIETHLRLLDIEDCHGARIARSEAEGYRSQLFYYWMQDIPVAPPPSHPTLTTHTPPCTPM